MVGNSSPFLVRGSSSSSLATFSSCYFDCSPHSGTAVLLKMIDRVAFLRSVCVTRWNRMNAVASVVFAPSALAKLKEDGEFGILPSDYWQSQNLTESAAFSMPIASPSEVPGSVGLVAVITGASAAAVLLVVGVVLVVCWQRRKANSWDGQGSGSSGEQEKTITNSTLGGLHTSLVQGPDSITSESTFWGSSRRVPGTRDQDVVDVVEA
jgi:hypothetical protein